MLNQCVLFLPVCSHFSFSACAGINGLMVFFPDRLHGAVDFMVGGLAAKGWSQFHVLYPYSIAGVLLAFTLAKKLNILQLGDEMSTSLGLNVERARFFLIAVSSLLAASAVSVVGLLGFVGLIVPHMTRLIIGSVFKIFTTGKCFVRSSAFNALRYICSYNY